MGEYTRELSGIGHAISPEDENYREELLEAAKAFRTFDEALDEFIASHGYEGDIRDFEGKIAFIREKFNAAGIEIDPRNIKSWYVKHTRADKREIAFAFCFAFGLNLEETGDFFRRVYLQRSPDCHSMKEAVCYYCLRRGLSYGEAQSLTARLPGDSGKGRIDFSGDVLYTGSIIRELEKIASPDELVKFLTANSEQFAYNNATAKRYILELWKRIAGEQGLAQREAALIGRKAEGMRTEKPSVWEVYRHIFGFLDADWDRSELFAMEGDRTLVPILKDNALVHPLARKSFPDRQGLEEIIRGNRQSDETVRKTMILLAFYRFWAERTVKSNSAVYTAAPDDPARCAADMNRLLTDSGYPELYEGNPYDWIFLFANEDPYPLEAFRFFMREVWLNKEETGEET